MNEEQLQRLLGITSGISSVGGGIADIIAANKAIRSADKNIGQAREFAGQSRKNILGYDFETAQAIRNLKTLGIQAPDTSSVDASTATLLESGANFDPSLLLRAATQQKQGLEQTAIDREIAAETNYANAVEAANLANYNKNLNLYQSDYAGALADIQNEQARKAAAENQKVEGVANIASGVVQGITGFAEQGGAVEQLLRRGEVVKTNGEFDHDTNKKALIDEETGEKEAELTGGEYVLNPEQGEAIHEAYMGIEQMVESGEQPSPEQLMMLYEAVRAVFSQPQFNEVA
tara:strand:+ start:5982 stop:6851 length:870 start_codon:yes stop_codon:yes gene_type:complete